MDCFALFPHGNVIAEISLLRKELINSVFQSEIKNNFHLTPLFSTFSILEFNSEVKKNTENDLSKISKLFTPSSFSKRF